MRELVFVSLLAVILVLLDGHAAAGQVTDDEKKEFNSTFKDLIVANDLKEE
jgi:hypothetical protein